MAILKQGSKGAEVATLQRVLNELGFNVGEADGDFGKRSHDGVWAFQGAVGLKPDGIVGPKTWDKLDEHFKPGEDNWTSSGVLTAGQVAEAEKPVAHPGDTNAHPKLKGCHPKLVTKMLQLIQLAAADGITVRISQGMRTFAEQDALYAKGRTAPGPKVTGAKSGSSLHQYGLAADTVVLVDGKVNWDFPRYAALTPYANKVGVEHGATWKLRDGPHFQLAGLPPTKVLLATYRAAGGGDKGIAAVWAKHV